MGMDGATADLGFARLDLGRAARTGLAETVYGPGKTPEQLTAIVAELLRRNGAALATRVSPAQAEALKACDWAGEYDPMSRTYVCGTPPEPTLGTVCVCTGGTGDLPVAEEAARCAAFFGARVAREFDVGVAGLHRLLGRLEAIRAADVVIAVAGMEGALPGVVAGLVAAPVVAVPTSVGYGASLQGLTPLLTMVNACAEGVTVVNIDNGFGAAAAAVRMLRLRERA